MNYEFFWKSNSPFSQWHPCEFTDDDIKFTSTEQYMMYQKAKLFKDKEISDKILNTTNPRSIKMYGRKVKKFNDKIWISHRERIVYNGNLLKFRQNKNLKKKLLETKDKILVEASPYDEIWGIGMSTNNKNHLDETKWRGLNLLGKCLMLVRNTIKNDN